MNFLDDLRRQRTRPTSIFQQYATSRKTGQGGVFLFVEGIDDQVFFLSAVRRYATSEEVHCFVCDGKRGVLEARDRIHQQKQSGDIVLYFIDKDIDDLLNIKSPMGNDIYCTEFYSVENYLVTRQMLEIVWTDVFRLSNSDERKSVILRRFETQYGRFLKAMRTLIAWVIKRRRAGEQARIRNLELESVMMVSADLELRPRHRWLSDVRRVCGANGDVAEWRDVRAVCASLRAAEPKTYVRGKFDLWFFVKFVNRLEEELRKAPDRSLRPKNRLTLSVGNALDVLAPRCPINDCLHNFLINNLGATPS